MATITLILLNLVVYKRFGPFIMLSKKFVINTGIVSAMLLIGSLVYFCKNPKTVSEYYTPQPLATHDSGAQFVGSETCMECHAAIYSAHLETAHYNTSAVADTTNIRGSFAKGSNILDLEQVKFTMSSESDALYQLTDIKNRTVNIPPMKFDVVIGSGVRGQSFATWQDDKLFQLQVSYHTPTDSWVNSPGFPSYYDDLRPIRDACLKCHVTFAQSSDLSGQGNQYEKDKMIYGVDCERCHRPGKNHIVYHRENSGADEPKFMMRLDSLSRQQRLDVCAQCHSGKRDHLLKGNSFSFLAGELLDEYARNSYSGNDENNLDVHGNQYGLLIKSRCFIQTETMDCNTCHDPHNNQRGNAGYFNQKCIGCHGSSNKTSCSEDANILKSAESDCINCHMPITPSKSMTVKLSEKDSVDTSFYIRTHLIGIYPEEVH